MDVADIQVFMSRCRYGVVSSISSDGKSQSALVGIAVTPKLEIVFDTVNSSRKYGNLVANSLCSFVVGGWGGEQTVQYEGIATELQSPELERYQRVYFAAWPECRTHVSWPGISYLVVRPIWIRYSDFDQSPPFIQEMKF